MSMMRNPEEVERVRRKHERENPLTQQQKYALLNAMYEEVKQLGRLRSGNTRERMKHKLAMARILNAKI
jgi:hypothetical protein